MLDKFLNWLLELCKTLGLRILIGLLILSVGLFIIKWVRRIIKRSSHLDKLDQSVRTFVSSFVSIALYIVLFITLAMILGIPVTSFITVLATVGAAIGLALQGALSNFAGGLMLLLFRPFAVGDYIETAGESGTVSEISVIYTVLLTPDNKQITIPNGSLTNAVIKNYSAKDTRRVDWLFTADYSCDSEKVKSIIEEVILSHELLLKEPNVFVRVSKCADSAIEYTARVWVNSADYWTVYFDVLEAVKKKFDENGIVVPYPQMDVHVKNGEIKIEK